MIREATRKDTPKVGTIQAQCCICWRMFSSDAVCETHKPYARLPGDLSVGRIAERAECTEPSSLGLVGRDRGDGVIVWSPTDDETHQLKVARLEAARAARTRKSKRAK